MSKRNIYSVVADVKKTLKSNKHYVFSEIYKKVYDICSLEIRFINSNGDIGVYDEQAGDGWFKFNQLMTKADAENEKRKYLAEHKQQRINLLKRFIEEYKQEIKELEKADEN